MGLREALRLAWTLGLGPVVLQGAVRTTHSRELHGYLTVQLQRARSHGEVRAGRRMTSGLENRRVIHQQLEGETVFSSTVPACTLELPSSSPNHAPEAAFTPDLSYDRGLRMWNGSL